VQRGRRWLFVDRLVPADEGEGALVLVDEVADVSPEWNPVTGVRNSRTAVIPGATGRRAESCAHGVGAAQ
jgi:hypothetical protein